MVNFFPEERREQLLMDLSLNIRALISQRLVPRESGQGRIAAMEIIINNNKAEFAADPGPDQFAVKLLGKIKEIISCWPGSDLHRA